MLLKPVFEKKDADWMIELPSEIKKNNTIHQSTKIKPIDAFMKMKEQIVRSSLQDSREKQGPKLKLGQSVKTADIKKVFSKGDSTIWSDTSCKKPKSYISIIKNEKLT